MEAHLTPFTLRDYQAENVAYYGDYRHGIAAWDMGTGKTLFAVEHAKQNVKGKRHLIVAPVNTHAGWVKTFQRQWPELPIVVLGSPTKDKEGWRKVFTSEPGNYIVGWEVMHGFVESIYDWVETTLINGSKVRRREKVGEIPHIPDWRSSGTWDLVVADECHRMQNRKSASHKVMMTIKADRKLAMSGTWTGNKKEGAYGTLHWLWPKKYPYFWPWVDKHFETAPDPYTYKRIVGELESGIILKSIPCYTRVEADVSNFPVAIHEVDVDMSPKQKGIYQRFKDEAFAWLDGMPVGTPLPITQRIRLRQVAMGLPSAVMLEKIEETIFVDGEEVTLTKEFANVYFRPNATSSKIDALKDIIKDLPENEPLMVYVHSKRFIEPVVHQLGGSAVPWTGDVPIADRMRILDRFGKPGGPRIIVAVIAAISEGTDGLQYVCANEVWLSQEDNNILNEQCKARLRRQGQTRMVNRWEIHARGTMDRGVYRKNALNRIEMQAFYKEEQ